MPKKPTDYSKTIIYKIQHIDNPELLYVGSTTDFTKRKYHHKSCCNNPNNRGHNFKLYKMIRENGNWDMFNMVVIKPFQCQNKQEALTEEDKLIREMKSSLNMNSNRAFTTPEEKQEQNKQWRLKHKDKIKERNKQYNLENKERSKQYNGQYYTERKDQIAENNKQKITCECGCVLRRDSLARHKPSKKHQDLLNKHLV